MRQISATAALLLVLALLAAPAWSEPIRISGRIEPAGAVGVRVELRPYIDVAGEALATARMAADGYVQPVEVPQKGELLILLSGSASR